ncbi:hypothetical protein C8R48DRAFT_668104 [Suillus tomentosus]|nr:hypothetical protein C8R48DRAFT_668104 [Suillus tomentosus]
MASTKNKKKAAAPPAKKSPLAVEDFKFEVEKIKIYPDAFVHTTKDKKHVECAMKNQYPDGFDPNKLKIYDSPNSFSLISLEDYEEALLAWHPPFLATQFCNIITERDQKTLITAWEDFFENALGTPAQLRMKELLEWWTRKAFGRNH